MPTPRKPSSGRKRATKSAKPNQAKKAAKKRAAAKKTSAKKATQQQPGVGEQEAAAPPKRDPYPKRLHPPERVLTQWSRRGKAVGEAGYRQRWAAFWKRVVTTLYARADDWKDEDLHLVAEYVRRCRLVELHVEEAELDPYPVNPDSGFKRPHPGWERSLAEAREARAIAVELRLTPRARRVSDIDIPPSDRPTGGRGAAGTSGRAADVGPNGETDGGWIDDQVGPDGDPL